MIVFLDCSDKPNIEQTIEAIQKAHSNSDLSIVDLEDIIPQKGCKAYRVDKECKLNIICFDDYINVDEPRFQLRGRDEKQIYTAIDLMYMFMFSSDVSQITEFDSDENKNEAQVLSWGGASDYFTIYICENGFISKGAIEYSNVYSEIETSAAHVFKHYLELSDVFPFHLSSTVFANLSQSQSFISLLILFLRSIKELYMRANIIPSLSILLPTTYIIRLKRIRTLWLSCIGLFNKVINGTIYFIFIRALSNLPRFTKLIFKPQFHLYFPHFL